MRLIDADALRESINAKFDRGGLSYDATSVLWEILTEIKYESTVEAYTGDEINAAIEDRDRVCQITSCRKCDYHKFCFTDTDEIQYGLLVGTYRKRNEGEKCD